MTGYILAIAMICIVVFFIFLKRKQDVVEASVQNRFAGKTIRLIDKYALYIARESDGYSHFRGTGYLVLTDDELSFERQLKKKTIIIPKNDIVKAEETKRLAGQSTGRSMLKVVFKTLDGGQDAIAWRVKELDRWIEAISMVMGSA